MGKEIFFGEFLSKVTERLFTKLFVQPPSVLRDLYKINRTNTVPACLFICEASPHKK